MMDPSAPALAATHTVSRDLKRVAMLAAIVNAVWIGLFATGIAGAFGGMPAPAPSAVPSSSPALAASVPEGFRMVCFKGADPHAIIRSAPAFNAPTAGVVLRGELIELGGPNPPVMAGNGFVKVHRTINGKQVTAWMHSDVLSATPCK
jgi:hypothetical protein